MKNCSLKPTGFARATHVTALAAALLLLGTVSGVCQGADPSAGSSFTWDCLTSGGNQPGIAYLTFSNDLTFKGYLLIAGLPPADPDNPRNPSANADQRGDAVSDSGTSSNFFVSGFTSVNGPWNYDNKGRVIGFFTEIINANAFETNWAGTCVRTVAPYIVTNYNGTNGTFDYRATATNSFCYTDVPFSHTNDWTATNSTGATNLFSQIFRATTPINFILSFGYVVTNANDTNVGTIDSTGTTNVQFNFSSSLVGTTNFTWSAVSSLGTTNEYSALIDFNASFPITATGGEATNAISFVGKVVPGKRLTLNASTSYGKVTFKGVPATGLPLLAGSEWYGDKRQDGQRFLEFFDLHPYPVDPDYRSLYRTTNGTGPGYSYSGWTVISRQKKIGFTFTETSGTNGTQRSTMGSINSQGSSAKTKGIIEPVTRIRFDAATVP